MVCMYYIYFYIYYYACYYSSVRACVRVVPPSYLQRFRIRVTMYGGGLRLKSLVVLGLALGVRVYGLRFTKFG